MPLPSFTQLTDGIDDILASHHNEAYNIIEQIAKGVPLADYAGSYTLTTDDLQLSDTDAPVLALDPNGANRVVYMPAPSTDNNPFYLRNASPTSDDYTISVRDNTTDDTELASVGASTGALLFSTADAWVATGGGGAGGSTFWTTVLGTPVRVGDTSFTVTGDYTNLLSKGTCLKWTQSGTKQGMIVSATYSAPDTTVTIIGDVLAIGFSDMKYGMEKARVLALAVAGTIGATGTDVAGHFYAPFDMKVFGADIRLGTAGNGTTTVDLNDDGTTMFTTKPSITTTGVSDLDNTADDGIVALEDSKLTADLDAAAATPGVDLYIYLYYAPNRNQYLT